MRIALDVDRAWAAGFFDGEGNVGCYKHSSRKQHDYLRLQVQIAQIDRQTLDRFQEIVGVGKVTGPFMLRGERRVHRWGSAAYQDVLTTRSILYPFLSSIKQRQFDEAIAEMDEYRAGAHERHVLAGKLAASVRWSQPREGVVV